MIKKNSLRSKWLRYIVEYLLISPLQPQFSFTKTVFAVFKIDIKANSDRHAFICSFI